MRGKRCGATFISLFLNSPALSSVRCWRPIFLPILRPFVYLFWNYFVYESARVVSSGMDR